MTNFEKEIIKTLILDFDKGLKLRKRYCKAVDRAFKIAFGESFGFELEVPNSYFITDDSAEDEYDEYKPWGFGNLQLHSRLTNIISGYNSTHPKYRAQASTDGPRISELSLPIYPKTLHILKKCLKEIKKNSMYNIGDIHDIGSSIHLHIPLSDRQFRKESKKWAQGYYYPKKKKPNCTKLICEILTYKEIVKTLEKISKKELINYIINSIVHILNNGSSENIEKSISELNITRISPIYYGILNLRRSFNTLEWRFFNGTTNPGKVLYYALLCSSIQRALLTEDLEVFELFIDITLHEKTKYILR